MEAWEIAVILGVVEGLTEFIPVSSTGHLIIASHLLGFFGEKAASFQVAIQFGAILAVLLLYWRRFADLLPLAKNAGQCKNSNLAGWTGIWRIAAATFPALVIGYLTKDLIKTYLFTPWAVTIALAGGGVAILIEAARNCDNGPGHRSGAISGSCPMARHFAVRCHDRRRHASRP